MISDNYTDETAQMLHELGYEAGFMGDLNGGEEIAIMHKDFTDGETTEVIEFYTVVPGTIKKQSYGDGNYTMRFILRGETGFTKPAAYGDSWGIYIRKP